MDYIDFWPFLFFRYKIGVLIKGFSILQRHREEMEFDWCENLAFFPVFSGCFLADIGGSMNDNYLFMEKTRIVYILVQMFERWVEWIDCTFIANYVKRWLWL